MSTIGTRSDAEKVLLGCPRKGPEIVENYPHVTDAIAPGIAGCLNTDGEFVAGAAAPVMGISRGQSMKHTDLTSVTLKGKEVPLKLTDLGVAAEGTVEIEDFAELLTDGFDVITVGTVGFTAQAGAAELGTATFRAATNDDATAASLALQINNHEDTMDLVEAVAVGPIVTITAREVGTAGNSIVLTYADEGSDTAATVSGSGTLEDGYDSFAYVVPGAAVFVDDTTGLATEEDSGTTEMNWRYASGPLDGVNPTIGGESADCALVNM